MDTAKKRRETATPLGRCHSCNRSEALQWHCGPDGSRSLCNRCGLHFAKLERDRQMKQRNNKTEAKKDQTADSHGAIESISQEGIYHVQRYLQSLDQNHTCRGGWSAVATLYNEATRCFRHMVQSISCLNPGEQAVTGYHSLKRSLDRLVLWGDAYDVAEGGLDRLVENSSLVRRQVMGLLVTISEILIDDLQAVVAARLTDKDLEHLNNTATSLRDALGFVSDMQSDYSSSIGSIEGEEDDTESEGALADTLKEHTLGLMELDQLLRNAIPDCDGESLTQTIIEQWSPHQNFCERVEQRFPLAARRLVERLGRANFDRYMRCQIERQRQVVQPGDADKLRDSGPGSSHASITLASSSVVSPYAETMMSYQNNGAQSARIPPLSDAAKDGVSFSCPACASTVTMRTNREWKKHLMADLRPWICLDADCDSGYNQFHSEDDWISHVSLEHATQSQWTAVICPLCLQSTGDGRLATIQHFAEHLEEISLSALPPVHEDDSGDDSKDGNISSTDHVHEGLLQYSDPPPCHETKQMATGVTAAVIADLTNNDVGNKSHKAFVSQVCGSCLHRESKCSGERPVCENCSIGGTRCHYPPSTPEGLVATPVVTTADSPNSKPKVNPSKSLFSQACDSCRRYKTRCSGHIQTCLACARRGTSCRYRWHPDKDESPVTRASLDGVEIKPKAPQPAQADDDQSILLLR